MTTKFKAPDFDTKIITPVFRLSYPHVFEAHYNELAKRDQFDLVMLFDKKTAKVDLKEMYALMQKVAIFRFGANPKGLKNPFKDGDTAKNQAGDLIKEKNPAAEGNMVLSSWSKNMPGIVNARREIVVDRDEIYGGCYCRAQLNCYAHETGGNKGVSFGLLNVQKVKDGEPFGTRVKAEDAFSPIAEEPSLAEPTEDSGLFG